MSDPGKLVSVEDAQDLLSPLNPESLSAQRSLAASTRLPNKWLGPSRPFYVGNGRGVRMLAHGLEAGDVNATEDGAKVARTREVRDAGLEHQILIARYGPSAAEYADVEGALIDVLT